MSCLCSEESPNHCDECTRQLLTDDVIERHRLAFAKKRARDLMKKSALATFGKKPQPRLEPKETA